MVVGCVIWGHADTCLCVPSNAFPLLLVRASQVADGKASSLGNAEGEVVLKFETHMYKVSHTEHHVCTNCVRRAPHATGGKALVVVQARTYGRPALNQGSGGSESRQKGTNTCVFMT